MNASFSLWGILNVTPDSFSDGDRHGSVANAVRRGEKMLADGATILDLGGESTRPGAVAISETGEMERVIPVIEALAKRCAVPISIDTYKSNVAAEAIRHGARIVNDVRGLQGDRAMAKVIADANAEVIIMYWRRGGYVGNAITEDMVNFWNESLAIADRAGILRSKIFLDPGIGFDKTFPQNLEILRTISHWRAQFSEFPFILGVSRKSFLGKIFQRPDPIDRDGASAAVAQFAYFAGVEHFRVHNVPLHREILTVAAHLKIDENESLLQNIDPV